VSPRQALAHLRFHWDDAYNFAFSNGSYTATAKFGNCEMLSAEDPEELLRKIRRHYRRDRLVEKSST
jgi:hypothetical protein